ncbi:DeoR/GlpR family DNA-binding transcription regulator [Ligilactobacillus animalis]|uniref:DeoR/GlpR family DNA-binding transcription regulator n=1 Tax=Ligilactobacillus animalis TaxID=1605 RepID=UPI0010A34F9C|nr:DeoR/GlpR family DNA-binding transcription regulator [Ligilactobacillus animalis]MDO5883030.1 DeoR/GlpR family DNA-binding transcription regulator [Ligilactobacillus animalis]MDU1486725.1 DeoR/GlpR family DNA-binding transcription regulator [Ligilactobacillus animalis]MDU8986702.1 DeoR/GlpR family DNA-binding transcription regulator [Ligilactobacillus animalis]THE21885.1 DeoR faimly transcriptional regulator [Ligilactobacillus animalis]THE22840.1 DeoR faimly transcriptional regulator [Ligil
MERLDKIIKLVSKERKVDVNTLSETLGVSKVTIRKDLDKLEAKGLLHREHGYAVLNSGDDINVRLSFHYDVKKKIAQKAAELVNDNETIIIESGSTCALLAEEICRTKRGVTILTNSYFIADYVKRYDSCKIVLLGGEYQKNSQVTVGPLVKEMIRLFHVQLAFIGTDGFAEAVGFTGKDLMRTEVVYAMAEVADEVVILTDSSKFLQRGTVGQFTPDQISGVITDKNISATKEAYLLQNQVKVTKV